MRPEIEQLRTVYQQQRAASRQVQPQQPSSMLQCFHRERI
ncbi:hypothetical protein EVA_18750 [gut metagenome]|uniref:Uncharacterized protein n=1 Tax=gut metagenome TaxID=749906 RepID=J9FU99_9ZZZZ